MYGLAVYYSLSLTTLESVYVAISSARVKMEGGRKERKQSKRKYQGRTKLKKKVGNRFRGAYHLGIPWRTK